MIYENNRFEKQFVEIKTRKFESAQNCANTQKTTLIFFALLDVKTLQSKATIFLVPSAKDFPLNKAEFRASHRLIKLS